MRTSSIATTLSSLSAAAIGGGSTVSIQADRPRPLFPLPFMHFPRQTRNMYGRKLGVFETYRAHHYKLLSARQKLSKNFRNHKRG